MRPDPRHIPLHHDRNQIDRRAQHGADPRRGEPQQPQPPPQSGWRTRRSRCRRLRSGRRLFNRGDRDSPRSESGSCMRSRACDALRFFAARIAMARVDDDFTRGSDIPPFQLRAFALGTGGRATAQHQTLKVKPAIEAGVFVDGHGRKPVKGDGGMED